ncbi:MAG: extracellular solute-binding protein [Clostridiales bacterium]|nr:extracellular solute-binding protein [Clostridiales bacterium]HBM80645.1 hypothetical protein [Clostridiaceae bacterium]
MKLEKFKRVVSVLLMVLMVLIMPGCGSKPGNKEGGNAGSNSADQYDKLPKEVSAIILDRGQVPASEGTYEENRWTKYINQNSGVKVKWVPVPRTQDIQKMNTLIASGQAPDLLWEYSRDYISQLVDQGALQPIDEYIQKYSIAYKNYLAKNSELKPYVTFNNKMYAFTSKRGIDSIANHAMWIRQDWLDKLGLKMPTTDEELFKVAEAFKNQDPDGNGKADTYGFAFNYNMAGIVSALYGAAWNIVDNGKIINPLNTERYKDVLAFRKKMFDEGLIDKEFITDTNFTRERQIWVTGKAGIYFGGWNMGNEWKDLKKNVPNAQMVPLESVSTKYGKFGMWQEPPANRIIGVNKDAKNPKAIVQLMDWLIDKGWFTITFGIEGSNYKMVNNVPQAIDADKNRTELGYSGEYALISQLDPKADWFPIMAASDAMSQEYAKVESLSLETQLKNKFPRTTPYNPTSTDISQLSTEFQPIQADIETKVVTGGSKYTVDWGIEQLRNERKRLGGDKVDAYVQEWYDKNKESFSK